MSSLSWTVCVAASTLLAAASNPVYVGAGYGLYKSTDAGASWTRVDIPLNSPLLAAPVIVRSLGIDPHDPSKIYGIGIARASFFFTTADGGRTWSAAPFVGMFGRKVAVDFAGQVVYITATTTNGTGDNLLYKSTDSGATWTRLKIPNPNTNNPPPNGSPVQYFAPDATVSGTVYVETNEDYFYKSADFGQTWTLVAKHITLPGGSVVPQTLVRDMQQDPHNPQTWYHATDHSSFPQTCPLSNGGLCGLFKSTDGGATFAGLGVPINYVTSVSVGAPSGTVYAAGDVGGLGSTVMKTTDGGATWKPVANGLFSSQNGKIWADPTDGSTLYVSDAIYANSFHVSTDAGAHFTRSVIPQGPPGCVPGNCQQQEIHDVLIVPSNQPSITSVVNGASLQPGLAANTWVTIFGTNLAAGTDNWNNSVVNGTLPTSVGGVNVSIGGKPAYVYYISPTQLNVLAADIAPGPVNVTVTTSLGTSPGAPATSDQFAPAFFTWPGNQVVATRQDYTYAVKPGTFPTATTVAAKPGDVLVLWGTGFGPTNPPVPTGLATPADKTYSAASAPFVTINGTRAIVFGAALAPGSAGLYQIAIQVPNNLPDGDYAIQAGVGSILSPSGTILSVHQ